MDPAVTGILTRTVARLLLLPTLVVAAAILVKGYAQTGDGFSAAVVGSLGVILQYLAFGRRAAEDLPLVRHVGRVSLVGLLVALLVAAAPVFWGEPPLTHYPRPGAEVVYFGTLELITAVLFDLGVFLLVFGFATGAIKALANAIAREDEYAGPDAKDVDAGAGTGAEVFAKGEGRG